MTYGIDVSKWQGSIDWQEVAQTQFKFAMLRASYGETGIDPYFYSNAMKASQAQLPIGAYHYCYAVTMDEAKQEAAHFINTIKKVPLAYPTVLDIEDKAQMALNRQTVTDIALAFLTALKEAGYYGMLYTYKDFAENKLYMNQLENFDFWLAQYREGQYTYPGKVDMWQYTSSGEVDGIEDHVDCNISYKDFPTIIKTGGYNHWKKEDEDMDEITVEEAKTIIQQKTGFDDNTMLYLEFYRYSESMIKRMALAMDNK